MPLVNHSPQDPVTVEAIPLTIFADYPQPPKKFMYADIIGFTGDEVTLTLSPGLPEEESRLLTFPDRINFKSPGDPDDIVHDPATATVVSAGTSVVTVDFVWRN